MTEVDSKKGQILVELMVALAIAAVLIAFGAQIAGISLTASKTSRERGTALRLAQEALEAARAIASGNDSFSQGWNRIYKPPDGSGDPATSKGSNKPYYPFVSSTSSPPVWVFYTGVEAVTLGEETYSRKVIIENVSRDSSGNVESTYNSANDDPATQKIAVTVSKSGTPDTVITEYITRFLNDSGPQSDWGGTQSCAAVSATSSPTVYCSCSPANSLSRTVGNFTLSASGSCSL